MNDPTTIAVHEKHTKAWIKKLAWGLPLFFLIKGLLWLAVPVLIAMYGIN
ncbi:MAG: hypothetical protein ABW176_20585 [Candidatus Thiodiazotropha endolucinida]